MRQRSEQTGKQYLAALSARIVLVLLIASALAFAIDAGILQYRVSTNRGPFSTVTVHPYYAVQMKDKKTEYLFDDPRDETCVNSFFPHMGNSPCWYRRRHLDEVTVE